MQNKMAEKDISGRYKNSNRLFSEAVNYIPLASQTFSKCAQQFPKGFAPLFLDRGLGARVWDVDGNEYVDLIGGLLTNVLGYCDPDINLAIKNQLDRGISFSLATELEIQLAKKLNSLIPCAEKVRFAKNGSDATTGCIRVARAATKKNIIICTGYHGWHDWYLSATTRDKGVPASLKDHTLKVPFNDLDALESVLVAHSSDVAAIMVEPMSAVWPHSTYLESLKRLAHNHGALLIFDEVVTGFRFSLGGAQEYFGVTPDLAAFGKALGNGMPISAVVGRADLMNEMEEVFFSSTFGGEALSIAAAIAVIDKLERLEGIQKIWKFGGLIRNKIDEIIAKHGLVDILSLVGADCWTILNFKDHKNSSKEEIKSLFVKVMLSEGVLINASNNVMLAHALDKESLSIILSAYEVACAQLSKSLCENSVLNDLSTEPIFPVFSVR